MKVNFSTMPDYDLVQQLFRADAWSARLVINGAPDDVCEEAEREVERLYEQVADKYDHHDDAMPAIRASMPGIRILMEHLEKTRCDCPYYTKEQECPH